MSLRPYYPPQQDELLHVQKITEYLDNEVLSSKHPFKKTYIFSTLLTRLYKRFIALFEFHFGIILYVENIERELRALNKANRTLLEQFLIKRIIVSWSMYETGVINNPYYLCVIKLGEIKDKTGKVLSPEGFTSAKGVGLDVNDAVTVALAETVERVVSVPSFEKDLQRISIDDITRKKKHFFYKNYLRNSGNIDNSKPIDWVLGENYFTKESILLPAGMIFIFYPWQYPEEPFLLDVSSNGVAAHTTKERAMLGGLLELIERDGFLMYWLTQTAPNCINIESIEDHDIQTMYKNLLSENKSVFLLDCKNECFIPVLVIVVVENNTGRVFTHASAGIDIETVLKKVFMDTLGTLLKQVVDYDKNMKVNSIGDRKKMWSSGQMSSEINFFVSGTIVSFQEYSKQFDVHSLDSDKEKLRYVSGKIMQKIKSEIYYYKYKHPLARENNLYVYRAIVPELLPIYFNEAKAHQTDRLFSFRRKMGFSQADILESDLNPTPHPFI